MEKQITLNLTEKKARILFDCLVVVTKEYDKLYEENKNPGTKDSADCLEEIFEDLREQICGD